jgi:hypothetical protein
LDASSSLGKLPGAVSRRLKGVTPQSPTLAINPENWYFVK